MARPAQRLLLMMGTPSVIGPAISISVESVTEASQVNDAAGQATLSGTYTGTPSWSLDDDAGGKYAINSSTGAITVADALEAGTDSITVSVSGITPTAAPASTDIVVGSIVPGEIADLAATAVDYETVALTYTAAPDATSHEVRYRIDGDPWGEWVSLVGDEVSGLEDATLYQFQVRGARGTSRGPASNTVTEATERWLPSDLGADLLAWWDTTHGVTESSGAVSAWADKIGPYSAAEATNQPTYSATSFNGRPGITFDGSNDLLTVASQPFPSGTNPSEIFVVCDILADAATSGVQTIFSYGGATTGVVRRITRAANNAINASGDNAGSVASAQNAAQDWAGRRVIHGIFSGAEVQVGVDGGSLSSPVTAVSTTGTTRVRVGAGTNNTATSFAQVIVGHVIVTGALSGDMRARMNKWALWARD